MKALLFNIQKFSLHDGAGIRTTVFFKGCNLRCIWCANPESQSPAPEPLGDGIAGRYYTLEEVLGEAIKDKPFYEQSGGGVTLSGGEPLMQADFAVALAKALHASNINTGIETALHADWDICRRVLSNMDFANIDLKHWNSEKHRAGTGVGNEKIISNLRAALHEGPPITVRIPVIPGYNDAHDDMRAFGTLLSGLHATDVHLLPFHQLGEGKYESMRKEYAFRGVPSLHEEDLSAHAKTLRAYGLHVQIGG